MTQRELLAWNGLDSRGASGSGSAPGVVAGRGAPAPAAAEPSLRHRAAKTHIVRRGDTLKGLAKRYGVSIQALREANGLAERETLRTGIALKIPG